MRPFRIVLSRVLGLMVSFLLVGNVYSQSDDTVRILDTLVVSEQKQAYSANESAVPVQRLTSRALRQLGVTNAGDALKHFSGVTVKDYGGVGGLKTVAVRGMGAQHTAVFYDGVAVGDCQSGQVDLGRFSTDNLNAVQLTIGQADDIYQWARMFASAGAISLESIAAAGNFLHIGGRCASYDTYQANIHLGRALGKGWHVTAFADYVNVGGCYSFSIRNAKKSISGRRINSDLEAVRAETNMQWSATSKHTMRVKIYGYDSRRGVPGAVIVDNPLSSDRLANRNLFAQAFYEYVPSSALRMKMALKHNYTYDRYTAPLLGNGKSSDEYTQHETDFSYTIKWSPLFAEGFSMSLAGELFRNSLETTNSHLTMPTTPRRLTQLSALALRYSGKNICVTASLLHTYADEWGGDGDVAPSRSRFSPAVSLAVYPFGQGLTFRLSYKDIFRLPTFNDLYYRESGNYLLRPEKSRMLNAGIALGNCRYGIFDDITLSVDAYSGRIEDKIVAVPGIFIWKMSNVNDVKLTGCDVNVATALRISSDTGIKLMAAYSYMHAVDDTDGSLVKGEQIVYTPRHSGSASAILSCRFADVGYSLVWSGARYRLPQNIPSNKVASYADHSLWLSRDWSVAGMMLTTKFEAMNLGGENYEVIRYYPMPGRNYRIAINIEL